MDQTPNIETDGQPVDPRQVRRDRWRRPLTSPYDRLRAWVNMIFVDHAFFRMAYLNLHRLSDQAWRAAQPLPYQITRLARTQGLKTVITLRGGQSFGSYPLEVEACAEAGLAFETFELRSRAIPAPEDILAADALFRRLEYPVLFHCKSGADRAGMVSALFLILHEGRPVSEARRQLSLRYGHIRHGKTGVLDALFETYLADQPDEAMPFLEWSQTRYDPDAITQAFKSGGLGAFLTETVLRRE
ncbi:MAG: tyrosine-protein phosphatase [Pseudomonadota bacterium]